MTALCPLHRGDGVGGSVASPPPSPVAPSTSSATPPPSSSSYSDLLLLLSLSSNITGCTQQRLLRRCSRHRLPQLRFYSSFIFFFSSSSSSSASSSVTLHAPPVRRYSIHGLPTSPPHTLNLPPLSFLPPMINRCLRSIFLSSHSLISPSLFIYFSLRILLGTLVSTKRPGHYQAYTTILLLLHTVTHQNDYVDTDQALYYKC